MSSKIILKPLDASSNSNFTHSKNRKSKKKSSLYYQNFDTYSKDKKVYSDEKEFPIKNNNINITKFNNKEFQIVYEDEYQGLIYHPQKYLDINSNNYLYETNNYKEKWKTEICHYWEMYGNCKFGNNCAFAHGDSELKKRKTTFNYKTKPCKQFFEIGYCSYGSRCQFSHKKEGQIKGENISYLKIVKEFLSDDNQISHDLVKRPRLKTFENLATCTIEESEKSRLQLYEDILNLKKENEFHKPKQEKIKHVKFSEDTNSNSNESNDNIND